MVLKRYGHINIHLKGYVYSLGGFSHKDLPNEVPVTLGSCEKYSIAANEWSYIGTMNESRSFAAAVALEN